MDEQTILLVFILKLKRLWSVCAESGLSIIEEYQLHMNGDIHSCAYKVEQVHSGDRRAARGLSRLDSSICTTRLRWSKNITWVDQALRVMTHDDWMVDCRGSLVRIGLESFRGSRFADSHGFLGITMTPDVI